MPLFSIEVAPLTGLRVVNMWCQNAFNISSRVLDCTTMFATSWAVMISVAMDTKLAHQRDDMEECRLSDRWRRPHHFCHSPIYTVIYDAHERKQPTHSVSVASYFQ
jgi:hypothetical protein